MGFHELVDAEENARFEEYARELVAMARARDGERGPTQRALHLKQHIGALGELSIKADAAAQRGVFAQSGRTFPLYARFSNGSGSRKGDRVPDARGFAIKLVGVEGSKIISGLESELTQDFLFIERPALPVRDPAEFVALVRAAKDGPAKVLPRLISQLGLRRAFTVVKSVLSNSPVKSYAERAFHTGAPITFAETAAKLALFPLSSVTPRTRSEGDDYLREDLAARLREGPMQWALRAQLFQDDNSTPIEDASVVWSGPWLDLGTLTLPRQDPDSPEGQRLSARVEQFSFDPWHAIPEHRPLGAIMRARAVTYRESVIARKAAAEPRSVEPG